MKILRRKSSDMGDRVMQFVAFSNMNMEHIQRNSPKAIAATKMSLLEAVVEELAQAERRHSLHRVSPML